MTYPKRIKHFNLSLKDGTEIQIKYSHFTKHGDTILPHIEFNGDVTETGYRSWFLGFVHEDEVGEIDNEIESIAKEQAEKLRTELLQYLKKNKRRTLKSEFSKIEQMSMF